MVMLRSNIFIAMLILVMLVGPRTAMAADTQGGKLGADVAGEEAPACQSKIGIKGRPHKLNPVARLSAVRAWTKWQ